MDPNQSVFSFESYRGFLQAFVKAEKNNWGLWAKLAKAAGCQATYLTQVMREKANLTADHALGICKFLGLENEATDFFLLLLDLERAGTPGLRQYLENKIEKIRRDREDLSKRLSLPRLEVSEKEALYYSSWYWSALHVIVTIPEYQTAAAIAKRLLLPVEAVEHALQQMASLNIVKKEGSRWVMGVADLHLPKTSPLVGLHHNNWRQRAVLSSTLPHNHDVHYTAVYSLSRKDFEHLKHKMNDFIAHTRHVVAPSSEEKLVAMTCDLFEV